RPQPQMVRIPRSVPRINRPRLRRNLRGSIYRRVHERLTHHFFGRTFFSYASATFVAASATNATLGYECPGPRDLCCTRRDKGNTGEWRRPSLLRMLHPARRTLRKKLRGSATKHVR